MTHAEAGTGGRMGVTVSTKTTVTLSGTSISVGELLRVLQGRDVTDMVLIKYSTGQRDSWVILEIGKPPSY